MLDSTALARPPQETMARGHVDDAARRFCRTPELIVDPLGHGPAFGQLLARDGGVSAAGGSRYAIIRIVATKCLASAARSRLATTGGMRIVLSE